MFAVTANKKIIKISNEPVMLYIFSESKMKAE